MQKHSKKQDAPFPRPFGATENDAQKLHAHDLLPMIVVRILCMKFNARKEDFMSREPFETMPDVMDAKQLAKALQISKAGAYNLLNDPDFPTLRIGGRKLVMKHELVEWLKSRTNRKV